MALGPDGRQVAPQGGMTAADWQALNAAQQQGGGGYLAQLNQTNQIGSALGLGQNNPLVAALVGEEAPAIAQYGQQVATGESGLLQGVGNYQAQNALLEQSTGLQQQQIGVQQQGNTLEQQNVAQQLGIAGEQYGLQQQLTGIQQGQLNYNLPIAVSQAESQAAGTGTVGTQGYGQKLGQIGEQYQVSSAELANQAAGQGVAYQGQQLSSANQIAQLKNTAASLGISTQQLQNQLSQGLLGTAQQLGQTTDQMQNQIAQGYAGEAQGLGAIYSNIGAITGLGPQAGYNLGSTLGAY